MAATASHAIEGILVDETIAFNLADLCQVRPDGRLEDR